MDNIFGERLRIFRKHKGLNQVQMAEVIGTKQANISAWELGTIPEGDNLDSIYQAFPELNEEWLFNRSETMLKQNGQDLSGWDKKYYALLEKYTALLEKHNNLK